MIKMLIGRFFSAVGMAIIMVSLEDTKKYITKRYEEYKQKQKGGE